jgi:hypothetical protein
MQQITSVLGIIAVWLLLSVGAWWLHRLLVHRKQRRKLALANEAWMRIREAPEIFADIRASGMAIAMADRPGRTHALLSRVRDYGDYFDDVSALRAELSRALKRDDCPPLTEILNLRRDMWAAADVLLIDDPAVFGEAFSQPGSYEEFCRDAEDLLFLDAEPLRDDPIALRLSLADEGMQTFVSGVEGEIADERERERFPSWREIIAYPVGWVRAVPRGLTWLGRVATRAGRAVGRLAAAVGRVALVGGAALWAVLREIPAAMGRGARSVYGLVARRPRFRFPQGQRSPIGPRMGVRLRNAMERAPRYAKAAGRNLAGLRQHPAVVRAAALLRRVGDRFPDRVTQGLSRAADMARDARARAQASTFSTRERVRDFEAGELGLHYDFLVKAHALRQRYADILRRAPELTDSGRQFIARLELEKRSERLRLGTAKLRRRARLELVRFLSVLIALLERLRDRLADAPPQPAQTTNLLTSPLHRLFLPPPSPKEAGADFPGGLRAQARSWARGWGRSSARMRDVTPDPDEAEQAEAQTPEAQEQPQARQRPEARETSAGPRQAERATASGRAATGDTQQNEADDPTEQAVHRVRRLFGIRDRKAKREAEKRGPAKRGENGTGKREHPSADAPNGNQGGANPRQDSDTTSAAQILPPLRGSRAGNYDKTDAGARSTDSLRSRLSGINDEQEEPSPPDEEAASEQRTRGRWRGWFGR